MTPVTLVTRDATLDDLSTQDYADIWTELRGYHSLRACIEMMGSTLSAATWQQYEKGERGLSRQMRNDLRRPFAHLPQLPATVAEAVSQASPDAAVWQVGIVGETTPDTVIMVTDSEPLWIHVSGSGVTVQDSPVSGVTRPQVARKQYVRPCVPVEYSERLQRLGVSWLEVIEAGLLEFEA